MGSFVSCSRNIAKLRSQAIQLTRGRSERITKEGVKKWCSRFNPAVASACLRVE